jgi:hypothetical protein
VLHRQSSPTVYKCERGSEDVTRSPWDDLD